MKAKRLLVVSVRTVSRDDRGAGGCGDRLERQGGGFCRQPQHGTAAGRADHGHDPPGHVRCGQLDRAQVPSLSCAAYGDANRLERGRRRGSGGNRTRQCRSARSGRDESRAEAYLASIPDSADKDEGVKLGEAVAAKILEARANDGAKAPDTYRPRTTPGVYVPTAPVAVPQWSGVKPFALTSASQFRPAPPIALDSEEWAADYNEIKDLGGRNSTKRSARQTEDARFWLAIDGKIYYPVITAIVAAKKPSVIDSARLFALAAAARADALIAVFDAKYQYEFWRPVTAIRNGDLDGNAATERDAAWQPVGPTPMHPEYPCAHCISSASLAGVVQTVFGTAEMPEVSIESPTLPGVVHRWTDVRAFTDECLASAHSGWVPLPLLGDRSARTWATRSANTW